LLGILLRSLIDRGKFSWFHALEATVILEDQGPKNIFDLVRRAHPRSVIKVSALNAFHICGNTVSIPKHSNTLSPILLQALKQMAEGCGRTKYPFQLLCSILKHEPTFLSPDELPDHCMMIPKVILTPSRQVVLGIDVEMSNRVVRRFVREEGFRSTDFLRLRVCDECEDRLYNRTLTDQIVSNLKRDILSGISINGVRYHFLAYSSSQLKELSVWMVAPPESWTIARMRQELGDFSGMTASKFAARIGQCFSTTIQTLPGSSNGRAASIPLGPFVNHCVKQDITSIHKGKEMIHSDGTGYIRQELMRELLKKVTYADPEVVSIIQIRYGGAKGTLTALPTQLNATIPGHCSVVLRPSMIKFAAPFSFLEVCRAGTRVPYYLNRNVVLLLGVHGVADDVFLNLQKQMLDDLDSMMVSKHDALRMVRGLGGPDQEQKTILLHMLQSDFFSPERDPFLFSCLLAIRAHHLHSLRKKARIFIEHGAVLLGGVDETGLLEEGCVFIQVARNGDFGLPVYEPRVGPVMVTKHPVMHPGDTRMLLAVDIPALRHLKNVIIFSQKGSRPEADKMSGSDLDGDECKAVLSY
jgi:RNA-dependent RNA polymerase